MVDNLPQVPPEKYEKLCAVVKADCYGHGLDKLLAAAQKDLEIEVL